MTDDPLTIRAFRAADTACLSEIWYRASLKAHSFLGRELLQDQRKQIEEIYLPQAETFVAMLSQRPVGFIGLLDSFIGGLFVTRRCRAAASAVRWWPTAWASSTR